MEKMKYMKKLGEKIHKRPRADAIKELNINNVRIETLILIDRFHIILDGNAPI